MRDSLARTLRSVSDLSLIVGLIVLPSWQHWVLQPRARPGIFFEYADFILYATDLFLLISIFTGLSSRALSGQGLDLRPRSITWPLVILIAWSGLSVWWALDKPLAAYQTLRLTLFFVFYLIWAQPDAPWRLASRALLFSIALQGGVGLAQFLRQQSLGLKALGEIELAATHGYSILSAAGREWLRAYGLTQHPNILGGVLTTGILLGSRDYWAGDASRRVYWLVVPFSLGLGGLVVSFSRSAWMGFLIGVVVMLVLSLADVQARSRYRRAWRGVLWACLLLVVFAGVFLGPIIFSRFGGRVNPLEARSIDERALGVREGIDTVLRHPLLGVGQANYPIARQAMTFAQHPEYGNVVPQQIHVVPLLIAAELGLPGAVLWLWAALAPFGALWLQRARRWHPSPELMAASGALAAIFTIGLFDYYPWLLQQGRLIQWLTWGLWASAWSRAAGDAA